MKVGLIMTASDTNHYGYRMLLKSLKKFGWDYGLCGSNYVAFGSKMVNAYRYAKETDCTHLFIVDAYDVVVLGTMEEALSKIPEKDVVMFNAEKACWPYDQWALLYPDIPSAWRYVNGGVAFVEVKKFIKMFEDNPIEHTDNDQVNLAAIYLTKRDKYNMQLDTGCRCFQSYAFHDDTDFEVIGDRLYNLKTDTYPVIIHGNGHTDMSVIYSLI